MIACRRGDVVLVRFVFADESGWKNRPALVLNNAQYQRRRRELIVAAITSNVTRLLYGDHLLVGWKNAGLLFPSVVTGILRTVKQDMVHRRLGALPEADLTALSALLRKTLALQDG
jgi:mRNA-degrading endonuclease toxin of MazEF toxin-antitoxin module